MLYDFACGSCVEGAAVLAAVLNRDQLLWHDTSNSVVDKGRAGQYGLAGGAGAGTGYES